jgi:hypothetical protein
MSLPDKYSNDEMERILQRALSIRANTGGISHEQLLEVGKELGLSEHDIARAIDEERRYGALDAAKAEIRARDFKEWRGHFAWYLGVNVVTVTANVLSSGGRLTWALGTLVGWGIGMAIHTIMTFFPDEKKLTKAARKLLRKRERRDDDDN